eukprot:TRINITY_DN756_c0_g1_i4.p1 TRINITY_DN756_c0_g1~~TRINITY_DN756_c0_g1_i4.p1  ORF type:complete len:510 (+),score=155.35 TRINITY_DN756_c0_g1_i4:132-1661(+)
MCIRDRVSTQSTGAPKHLGMETTSLTHPGRDQERRSNTGLLVGAAVLSLTAVAALVFVFGGASPSHAPESGIELVSKAASPDLASFFHISDVHVEPFFNTEDMKTAVIKSAHKVCRIPDERLHTIENMFAADVHDKRYYGRYHCDPPIELLKCALDGMRQLQHDPMFIAVSGDLAAHKIKRQVVQEATQNAVLTAMKSSFRYSSFLVAVGNNDPWPPNSMSPGILERLWSQVYREHLPPSVEETFLKGGYYSQEIRNSTITGIVINTLLCDDRRKINISMDMRTAWKDQNQWLDAELTRAAAAGRKAVIVSHVPPGPGQGWAHDAHLGFSQTITKHQKTIMSLLFGDMNQEVYRSIGGVVAMVVAGVSPRVPNNPVFREFEVDKITAELNDIRTFYNDIQTSNERHSALIKKSSDPFSSNAACSTNWKMLFSAKARGDLHTCSQPELRVFLDQLMKGGFPMIQYKHQMTGAYIELDEWVQIACATKNDMFDDTMMQCAKKYTDYYRQFG